MLKEYEFQIFGIITVFVG